MLAVIVEPVWQLNLRLVEEDILVLLQGWLREVSLMIVLTLDLMVGACHLLGLPVLEFGQLHLVGAEGVIDAR